VGAAMINAFTHLDPDPRNPNPGTSLCPVACTWDKGGFEPQDPEHWWGLVSPKASPLSTAPAIRNPKHESLTRVPNPDTRSPEPGSLDLSLEKTQIPAPSPETRDPSPEICAPRGQRPLVLSPASG
jgi:hypothetical protein